MVNLGCLLMCTFRNSLFWLLRIQSWRLKELRNCISRIIRVWSLFCSIRVYKSAFSTDSSGKLVFFLSFRAFYIFCLFCVEFDVSFINFLTLHNHCFSSKCQVLCVFVLTYLIQFVKTDARHKNLSIALNKKHTSSEFWVLKIPFIKENIHKLKKYKTLLTDLRSRNFVVNLWYQQHWSVTVEITDIKCGLLAEHLFQRRQQHGSFTIPLGNDKFV